MRKFLFNIVLFSVMMIAAGSLLSFLVDKGLRKSEYPLYREWNDIYNSKINADMLFCGSSHARVQISPEIMDSMLGFNTYNLGIDGYPFDMQYARFKIYLEHNRFPQFIIQNIDIETLEKSETPFMSAQFLPYLSDPLLKPILLNTITPPYCFYFYFYKYAGHFDLVNIGLAEYFNPGIYKVEKFKGYEGLYGISIEDFKRLKSRDQLIKPTLDPFIIAEFESFLRDCKRRNIYVVLVCCPQYYEFTKKIADRDQFTALFKSLTLRYDVPLLDYTNDRLCYDVNYFYNPSHLNKHGSELFSVKLANDVKKLINKGVQN